MTTTEQQSIPGWGVTFDENASIFDDFEYEVTDAYFAVNEAYAAKGGGDTHLLHLVGKMSIDGTPVQTKDGEPIVDKVLTYSVGKGWATSDGGKSITHADPDKNINANTNFATLLRAVDELGAVSTLAARGNWNEAHPWVGTKWHIKRVPMTNNPNAALEGKTTLKEMPTAFLGVVAEGAVSNGNAAPAGAVPEASPHDRLIALFRNGQDFAATVQQALKEIPAIAADPALLSAVTDQTVLWDGVKSGAVA